LRARLTRRASQQARGAPSAPREPKPQKHIITAYNRDNQMLLRRKKARCAVLRLRRRRAQHACVLLGRGPLRARGSQAAAPHSVAGFVGAHDTTVLSGCRCAVSSATPANACKRLSSVSLPCSTRAGDCKRSRHEAHSHARRADSGFAEGASPQGATPERDAHPPSLRSSAPSSWAFCSIRRGRP